MIKKSQSAEALLDRLSCLPKNLKAAEEVGAVTVVYPVPKAVGSPDIGPFGKD